MHGIGFAFESPLGFPRVEHIKKTFACESLTDFPIWDPQEQMFL